jgi:hypothetical protein
MQSCGHFAHPDDAGPIGCASSSWITSESRTDGAGSSRRVRASGFTDSEVTVYVGEIRKRIAQLQNLEENSKQ